MNCLFQFNFICIQLFPNCIQLHSITFNSFKLHWFTYINYFKLCSINAHFVVYGLHVLSALNKDSALLLPGHGYCSCGRCICQDGWFGKVCQFPRSCDMSDAQSREHCETADGVVCNGKGEQIVFDCALKAIFLSKARVFTFSSHVAQQCATCEQQWQMTPLF